MPEPTDPKPPCNVIGRRTRFLGTSGEHPHLRGHDVVVIAVIPGSATIVPGVEHDYVTDEQVLTEAGGLDVGSDRLDVQPLNSDLAAPGGEKNRFATSDVRATDLEAWATTAEPPALPPKDVSKPVEDPEKQRLILQIEGQISRETGKQYRISLAPLDKTSLVELLRLLRDLEGERASAVRRAQMAPWRR